MKLQMLTEDIRIGRSRYEPGTVVTTGNTPTHEGDPHNECWLVVFPSREGTFLSTRQIEPLVHLGFGQCVGKFSGRSV